MSVLISSFLRSQRTVTHPGWLHHRCHGSVLRTAHRCGQGSVSGADEPEQCGAALQRHHAGLQTHLPQRGFSGTLERCRTRVSLTRALPNHKCVTMVFWFLQARCPISPETPWLTAQSWWRTIWSKRPFWSTNSCQVWHTHTHTKSSNF